MAKVITVKRIDNPSEHAKTGNKVDQATRRELLYEPAPGDPEALLRNCPVCVARIGQWCGGFGDIHIERRSAAERKRIVAEDNARIERELKEQTRSESS